jgi:hypothetical protein
MGWRYPGRRVAEALVLTTLLWGCGDPGDDGDDPPVVDQDKTPINKELSLGIDGEMPDMAVGPDGTLHVVYRRVLAPQVTLFYTRKAPLENVWTAPVEVAGSSNAAYRWFAFPDIAVGADGRVHFVWTPEPYDHNGMFYTSCVACDGSDWRGRPGESFSRLTDDLVEFFEICVSQSNIVHIAAMQLYRRRPGGGFDETDQMVHYFAPNGGQDPWQAQQIIALAFEDLNMTCTGENIDLFMRFRDARWSRYAQDGNGERRWTTQGIRYKGAGLSEINPLISLQGAMNGYVYSSWGGDGPSQIHYAASPATESFANLVDGSYRRPNNTVATEGASGERMAFWADNEGRMHWSHHNKQAWGPDTLLQAKVQPMGANPGAVAVWNYSAGHGWGGRILWPAVTMVEHGGSYHLLYRATVEYTETSTTKTGDFRYVRFQPGAL